MLAALQGRLSTISESLRRSYLLALCCYLFSGLDNYVPRRWTFDRTDLLGYRQFDTCIHELVNSSSGWSFEGAKRKGVWVFMVDAIQCWRGPWEGGEESTMESSLKEKR